MRVLDLVTRCASARDSADTIASVRAELEKLRGDVAEVERVLACVLVYEDYH